MKTRKPLLAAVLVGTVAVVALLVAADPIDDNTAATYRAGWFNSASRAGVRTCQATCDAQRPAGARAEYEASSVSPTRRAFVCKVPGRPKGEVDTWLYGSQFDNRPACYTTGLDLEGAYHERYHCLCVWEG